jgi:hypothetical protein
MTRCEYTGREGSFRTSSILLSGTCLEWSCSGFAPNGLTRFSYSRSATKWQYFDARSRREPFGCLHLGLDRRGEVAQGDGEDGVGEQVTPEVITLAAGVKPTCGCRKPHPAHQPGTMSQKERRHLPSNLRPAFGSTCGETRSRWRPRNPGQQYNWGFRLPQVAEPVSDPCCLAHNGSTSETN